MSCTNEPIWALLPDYHAGSLDAEQHAAVETHLATCEECRDVVRLMEILTDQGQTDRSTPDGGHVPAGLLARYYSHRRALSQSEVSNIETHLQACNDCAGELRFLEELESELNESVRATQAAKPAPVKRTFVSFLFGQPVASLALAAVLVVAIFALDRLKSPAGPSASFGDYRFQYLPAPKRSVTQISTIVRSPADSIAAIGLLQSHTNTRLSYGFRLLDEDQAPLSGVRFVPDLQLPDTVRLLADTHGIDDGVYRLEFIEFDTATRTDSVIVQYLFELVTQD